MINWNRYFDKIFCVCYLGGDKESDFTRLKCLFNQCDITDVEYKYDFDSKYRDVMSSSIVNSDLNKMSNLDERVVRIFLQHYNIIKQSYLLGYDRILVLEDDITLLKDKDLLKSYLDNIPSDYDLILFDWIQIKGDNYSEDYNKYYYKINSGLTTGLYSLSRSGMKIMIHMMESIIMNADQYFLDLKHKNYNLNRDQYRSYSEYVPIDMVKYRPNVRLGYQLGNKSYFDSIYEPTEINTDKYL